MSHIFISYSKQNRTYARQLADHLLSLGYDVWIDDRIDFGEDWELAIFDAIDRCAAFIVVMTPDSYASKWVRRECHHAEKRKKPESPVLLEGEEFPRYGLNQYADVRSGRLPPNDFYTRLSTKAPRKSAHGLDVTETPDAPISPRPPVTVGTPFLASTDPEPTTTDHSALIQQLTGTVLQFLPPPFDWCFVPGGSVTLDTNPPKNYTVEDFLIAKYTITNAQFEKFVTERDGYIGEMSWFDFSPEAMKYRAVNPKPKTTAFGGDDLPRTNLSWFDAVAFCRWLSNQIGQSITLPTEQQWQRAAIGETDWNYPWGKDFDSARCCFATDKPSNVTAYTNGSSPFGVIQMSGNVWNWCLNTHDKPDIDNLDTVTQKRVLRGGSWNVNLPEIMRATNRSHETPETRSPKVGFRIVTAIPSS